MSAVLITNVFIPVKYFFEFTVRGSKNTAGELRITYLDVGFGDCSLVELPDGKTVLIDGGSGDYNVMRKVFRTLNSRGVDRIDYLICTSVKSEHCGGFTEVLKYKTVGSAFIPYCRNAYISTEYKSFVSALEKKDIQYSYACVGEGIDGGENGYFLTFLSPVEYGNPNSEYAALNSSPTAGNIENASAVVWLQYGNDCFVFTSDIREKGLKRITDDYYACKALNLPFCGFGGKSVVLENCSAVTVAAHGGGNNTYAPWYDLIKPQTAIISVGKSFSDYPSLKAEADVGAYCKPLYTMDSGNITAVSYGNGYTVQTEK